MTCPHAGGGQLVTPGCLATSLRDVLRHGSGMSWTRTLPPLQSKTPGQRRFSESIRKPPLAFDVSGMSADIAAAAPGCERVEVSGAMRHERWRTSAESRGQLKPRTSLASTQRSRMASAKLIRLDPESSSPTPERLGIQGRQAVSTPRSAGVTASVHGGDRAVAARCVEPGIARVRLRRNPVGAGWTCAGDCPRYRVAMSTTNRYRTSEASTRS